MNNVRSSNWQEFVTEIASGLASGDSLIELSEKYENAEVIWDGKLREPKLDDEYITGVMIDMPRAEASAGNSKKLVSDYVFLNIDSSDKEAWRNINKGQEVSFRAKLGKAGGVFPVVDVDEFPDNPEIVLSLALVKAVPVQR